MLLVSGTLEQPSDLKTPQLWKENIMTITFPECATCPHSFNEKYGPLFPRFLPEQEVVERTTLARATIWRGVKAGTFPKPAKISTHRVAWYEHEVNAWILAQRDG